LTISASVKKWMRQRQISQVCVTLVYGV
jgi:hypothetical protein